MTRILATLALALVLAACSAEKDEAGIAAANKKYMGFIAAKDAAGAASLFADDGAAFPPNAPRVEGRENLQKLFADMLAAPGFESLTWSTDKLVFSESGDMAVDIGPYEFKAGGTAETGKTVVVWVKRGGEWKILADTFSSNAPAEPRAAAAAPVAIPATDAAPYSSEASSPADGFTAPSAPAAMPAPTAPALTPAAPAMTPAAPSPAPPPPPREPTH